MRKVILACVLAAVAVVPFATPAQAFVPTPQDQCWSWHQFWGTYPPYEVSTNADNFYAVFMAECVYGGSGLNTIQASGETNAVLYFYGAGGSDNLLGGDHSNDLMGGGGAADSLYGERLIDALYGNGGDDFLSGGAHDDTIWDGTGHDVINGGTGYDAWYQCTDATSDTATNIEEVIQVSGDSCDW